MAESWPPALFSVARRVRGSVLAVLRRVGCVLQLRAGGQAAAAAACW